jgi:hypothetical protein
MSSNDGKIIEKETKDINFVEEGSQLDDTAITHQKLDDDSPYADIKDNDSGPQSCFSGILDDISRRKVHYFDDWTNLHSKIISSSIYIFLASVAPALTFALFLETETEGINLFIYY